MASELLQYIAGSKSQFTFAEVQQLFAAIQNAEELSNGNHVEDHK